MYTRWFFINQTLCSPILSSTLKPFPHDFSWVQADHPDRDNMQPSWKRRQAPAFHLSRSTRQAPSADRGRPHQGRRCHPAVRRGQLLEGRRVGRLPHPRPRRPHWHWNSCWPSNEEVSWTNVNQSNSYTETFSLFLKSVSPHFWNLVIFAFEQYSSCLQVITQKF